MKSKTVASIMRHVASKVPSVDGEVLEGEQAKKAEAEADRALASARTSVREAREEVKRLEREAEEEARRAKIKQYHAREVSKRGNQLGRKFALLVEIVIYVVAVC